MYGADGGKMWERGVVGPLRLSTVEALVLAQANADGERRKEKKVKNVYNNKIILILYYI